MAPGALRIAELPLGPGRLGVSACPGLGSADLKADLAALQAWGARLVVTACTSEELRELDLADLGDTIEAAGIEWHHVPIRDLGIPDARAEGRWHWARLRLHRLLAQGERALIHCQAGLGRSGLLAARLLIDARHDPDTAMARVRTSCPGAIENDAQAMHLRLAAPCPEPPSPGQPPTYPERVLGSLLAGALGDAMGYEVEFDSLQAIRGRFGPAGLREPVLHQGRLHVSDDTQMTLFTAEGLLRGRELTDRGRLRLVWRAYRRWLETQGMFPALSHELPSSWLSDHGALRHARAPGRTCLEALAGNRPGSALEPLNSSKGCGGVMRVAPVGYLRWNTVGSVFHLAASLAALTHGHPSGYWPAGALAAILRVLIDGAPLAAAVRRSLELLEPHPEAEETTRAIQGALNLTAGGVPIAFHKLGALGLGWVGEEALAIGLAAALAGRDLLEALAIAVNHDGDSDSTASLAGQLRGAVDGVQAVPARFARRLDVLDPLLTIAHDLTEMSALRGPHLLAAYPAL